MELEAEVAQLRARQAAIEEQLQTERTEREKERADFESRVQAQIENMLRMAGIQSPNHPPGYILAFISFFFNINF